jgi:hypothetical protein
VELVPGGARPWRGGAGIARRGGGDPWRRRPWSVAQAAVEEAATPGGVGPHPWRRPSSRRQRLAELALARGGAGRGGGGWRRGGGGWCLSDRERLVGGNEGGGS